MMQMNPTNIPDCVAVQYQPYNDNRGVFCEIFKQSGLPWFKPTQSNYSFSKKGVLRGLHRTPYAKLVTCVYGSVFDVCVDLRENSNTYEQYFSTVLSENNHMALYIPPYCGHGFLALQDSIVIYQQSQEHDVKTDETYCYKNFNIVWPICSPLILSNKDSNVCN
jgi:dTDP-4-dehydrorhamnose 3,5-epimerase